MTKVQELQDAVNEMKQTIATEADELFTKFDELQAQIDAKVDPSSLDPVIQDIRGSLTNIQALSEGRPTTEEPTEPVEPVPTEPEAPVEPTPTEPTDPTVPDDGGDGSDEEPMF